MLTMFSLCTQVPFDTGTWSLDFRTTNPCDCKKLQVKAGYLSAQVQLKKCFTAVILATLYATT